MQILQAKSVHLKRTEKENQHQLWEKPDTLHTGSVTKCRHLHRATEASRSPQSRCEALHDALDQACSLSSKAEISGLPGRGMSHKQEGPFEQHRWLFWGSIPRAGNLGVGRMSWGDQGWGKPPPLPAPVKPVYSDPSLMETTTPTSEPLQSSVELELPKVWVKIRGAGIWRKKRTGKFWISGEWWEWGQRATLRDHLLSVTGRWLFQLSHQVLPARRKHCSKPCSVFPTPSYGYKTFFLEGTTFCGK